MAAQLVSTLWLAPVCALTVMLVAMHLQQGHLWATACPVPMAATAMRPDLRVSLAHPASTPQALGAVMPSAAPVLMAHGLQPAAQHALLVQLAVLQLALVPLLPFAWHVLWGSTLAWMAPRPAWSVSWGAPPALRQRLCVWTAL